MLARFKNNSAGVKETLFKIKKSDDPCCDHCRNTIESASHFILYSPNYIQQRRCLKDKLAKIGVQDINLPVLLSYEKFPEKYPHIMRTFQEFIITGRENL